MNEFHVYTCVSSPKYLIMYMQIFQNLKKKSKVENTFSFQAHEGHSTYFSLFFWI